MEINTGVDQVLFEPPCSKLAMSADKSSMDIAAHQNDSLTNHEIKELAEKTGLQVEEFLGKMKQSLLRNRAYVKICGPKNKVRIELFSIKTSPEEGAIARKWLSDHAADLPVVSDYIDGAVDVGSVDSTRTPRELTEIAKVAQIISDEHVRTAFAEDVYAQNRRYIKPNSPPSPNWFKKANSETDAWEHRPRIFDNKIKHRLENSRKSSKTRRDCPDWFHDDLAVFAVLLLKHRWETRADKLAAEETRFEFDAVKYWTNGVVSDESPLLGMTDDHIRVTVGRFRKFGNGNLPPSLPLEARSFEDIALFLWLQLSYTVNTQMTQPFAAFRRAMQLSHQLLKIPIPLHPRYLKTHPPDSLEKMP
jgi:hypothetical protein